ncbi:hypothetical protein MRX96_002604 [Rhipicephalus microplus]
MAENQTKRRRRRRVPIEASRSVRGGGESRSSKGAGVLAHTAGDNWATAARASESIQASFLAFARDFSSVQIGELLRRCSSRRRNPGPYPVPAYWHRSPPFVGCRSWSSPSYQRVCGEHCFTHQDVGIVCSEREAVPSCT